MHSPLPIPPQLPGIPLLGNVIDFRRNPVKLLQRGYETFGLIFSIRLGPMRAAVILGPENNNFFFKETDKILSMSEVYKIFIPIFGDGFTLAVEPKEYKEQRAVLQPAFHSGKMSQYVEVMVDEIVAWLNERGERGEFELCETFERLSVEITARALMGDEFRQRMGDDFWFLYRDVVRGIDVLFPPNLPLPRFRRRDRAREILHSRIRTLIAERRAQVNGHEDFMQWMATSRYSDGRLIPEDRLASMILFLVFSASESTPIQASWSLIHLLQHPEYLTTVLKEQAAVLGDNASPLNLNTLTKLNKLDCALKETERLRPMTTMLWRKNIKSYELGGYYIPKGWVTIICPAVSHRIPETFSDPDVYHPERFCPNDMESSKNAHNLAGFGGGPHKCPGMYFAYNLIKVLLSSLLQRYRLELVNPDPQPDYSTSICRPETPCLISYQRL
jgi:sterol 14-demethylase